jgi:hypothetical protein
MTKQSVMEREWENEYWAGYGNQLNDLEKDLGDDMLCFIRSLLTNQATEIGKEVGELKMTLNSIKHFEGKEWEEHKMAVAGRNQAITDVLSIINKYKDMKK